MTSPAVAVAVGILLGALSGAAWYAVARGRGLTAWAAWASFLMPAALVRCALPTEFVLPFDEVFSRRPLTTEMAVLRAWSGWGLLSSVAGSACGAALALLAERRGILRAGTLRDRPTPDAWVATLVATLLTVVVLSLTAYQRFLTAYSTARCELGCTFDMPWPLVQENSSQSQYPRLDALLLAWSFPDGALGGQVAIVGWLRIATIVVVALGVAYVAIDLLRSCLPASSKVRSVIGWAIGGTAGAGVLAGGAVMARLWHQEIAAGAPSTPGWPRLAVLGLAVSVLGFVGAGFLAVFRRSEQGVDLGPFWIAWALFSAMLRFSVENAVNTDLRFRGGEQDLLLVRFFPECYVVVAAAASLTIVLTPGAAFSAWLKPAWKAGARCLLLAAALSAALLSLPFAHDAGVAVAWPPWTNLSVVEQCRLPLPESAFYASRPRRPLAQYLRRPLDGENPADDDEAARLFGQSLVSTYQTRRAIGSPQPRVFALMAPLDTPAEAAFVILKGAAAAHHDVLVGAQRLSHLPTRTLQVARLEELCSAGVIHLSGQGGVAIASGWTLRDLIEKSATSPIDPSLHP